VHHDQHRRTAFFPLQMPLLAAIFCLAGQARAQTSVPAADPAAPADSLQSAYFRALSTLSSPELEARVSRRRTLQQEGYAEVLYEALRGDGLSALMSWLRTTLLLEYSIPRFPLSVTVRGPETRRDTSIAGLMLRSTESRVTLPLIEDRSYPANPWAPASKRKGP
jgi:hypothetical protein